MADFQQLEDADGVRMTWNIWPNSKLEATKCVIPFAAFYTPNKRLPHMPVRAGLTVQLRLACAGAQLLSRASCRGLRAGQAPCSLRGPL